MEKENSCLISGGGCGGGGGARGHAQNQSISHQWGPVCPPAVAGMYLIAKLAKHMALALAPIVTGGNDETDPRTNHSSSSSSEPLISRIIFNVEMKCRASRTNRNNDTYPAGQTMEMQIWIRIWRLRNEWKKESGGLGVLGPNDGRAWRRCAARAWLSCNGERRPVRPLVPSHAMSGPRNFAAKPSKQHLTEKKKRLGTVNLLVQKVQKIYRVTCRAVCRRLDNQLGATTIQRAVTAISDGGPGQCVITR